MSPAMPPSRPALNSVFSVFTVTSGALSVAAGSLVFGVETFGFSVIDMRGTLHNELPPDGTEPHPEKAAGRSVSSNIGVVDKIGKRRHQDMRDIA